MKKYIIFGILLILSGITYMYKSDILNFYYNFFVKKTREVKLNQKNKYYRDYDFSYVQNTTNFTPSNEQDILNIYYTVLNSGNTEFTFYCPEQYKTCIKDIKALANDQVKLTHINNYVHPYNSFSNIETTTDSLGTVTITITKAYSDTDISIIDEAIKNIEKEVLDPSLSTKEQIKKIHNYIIDNSKYDSNRTDNGIIEYKSDIAYGPLIEGYGICGGYSDAMELFLENLGIKSFKIASDMHVWNAVELYNSWYHLDLTWDDPVTSNGVDLLEDNFFMIDSPSLEKLEKTQHTFDKNVYQEMK